MVFEDERQRMHTVDTLKAHIQNHGKPGLVVDIDDVLCVTGRYWYEALKEIAGEPGFTFEEIVEKYGKFQNLPTWGKDPRVVEWMDDAMRFGRHHLKYVPIEKARERFIDLQEHVPLHAYMTMRPTSSLESTEAWLRLHGFPELPVLSRPSEIPHHEMQMWKGTALGELHPTVAGIIDDDPHVIEELPEGYQGTIFLFGDRQYKRQDLDVVRCRNWDEVYERVKERGFSQP